MQTSQNLQNQTNGFFLNFSPAVLRKYKSAWMIEYYVENPISHKQERKRIKVEHIKNRYRLVKDAITHINNICLNINSKLMNGWNPFTEGDNARMYMTFADIAPLFMKEKEKELRPATIRSYKSQIKQFCDFFAFT